MPDLLRRLFVTEEETTADAAYDIRNKSSCTYIKKFPPVIISVLMSNPEGVQQKKLWKTSHTVLQLYIQY